MRAFLLCIVASCSSGADPTSTPPLENAPQEDAAPPGTDATAFSNEAGTDARVVTDAHRDVGVPDGPAPSPGTLPQPTGPCPTLVTGNGLDVALTTTLGPRKVRVWVDTAKASALHGPVVFSWHGLGDIPTGAGMDGASRTRLLGMGGMFVAPYLRPNAPTGYWESSDLITVDTFLACAHQSLGIDTRRIYGMGLSAGGREALRFGLERSGYVAAIIAYSPGTNGTFQATQDPNNKFPTLLTYGSAEPTIFKDLAEGYFDLLTGKGHFVGMCKHSLGHTIPSDVAKEALTFFLDHPFGTRPSPYAGGFPVAFPTHCGLTK